MKLLLLLIGVAFANAAFRTCDRKLFSKVGCYKRDPLLPLLPDMLLNGRETTQKYMPESGLINWRDYNNYIHSLACECAEKAKSDGYVYFAIGFYGECFGGKDRVRISTSLSSSSKAENCVKGDYGKCESDSEAGKHECVGTASHEYVYSIQASSGSDTKNVDGGYGDWSDWTKCDKSCGEGIKIRERACSNPLPSGAGKNCEELGPSSQTEKCTIKECPTQAPVSGWTPAKSDSCIAGHHIKTFNNIANIQACGALCDKESSCKSVDYHPVSKACHFNNADTKTVPVTSPCQGYTFSEPSGNTFIVSGWTSSTTGCIAGHHIKTFNNIANIQACGDLCDKESSCKSVDYHPVSKACHFNNANTSTVKVTVNCQGYTFSEPKRS